MVLQVPWFPGKALSSSHFASIPLRCIAALPWVNYWLWSLEPSLLLEGGDHIWSAHLPSAWGTMKPLIP